MCAIPVDVALVAEAQHGNPTAREELFRTVHKRILGFQLKLHGGRLDDAQEATQESLVRIIPALADLREPASFLPWALRIATNVWRDRLRARRASELPDEIEAPTGHQPVEMDESIAQVLSGLADLEEPYRMAVTLRYLEGLDYDTMSEVVEVPAVTLRSQVARGLQMIRERLGGCS